ncbi:DUF4144 family protein [Photobacterium sp. R1]
MVIWPAVLKYDGDPELVYLADQVVWESDADLHCFGFQAGDVLIDSDGQVFCLESQARDSIWHLSAERQMPLAEMITLIQSHQSCQGACCAAKVSFPTFSKAIAALADSAQ